MTTILLIHFLLSSDFPICTAENFQDYPVVCYTGDLFYVFWIDKRFYYPNEQFAVFGARVAVDGHVIDPNGRLIYCDSTADKFDVALGGDNSLAVCRNHC